MRNVRQFRRVLALLPLGLPLAACSGDTVDLGGDGDGTGEGGAVCGAAGSATGHFAVTDQAGLDALAGCREINGSLMIGLFDADFTPLRELQQVNGALSVGWESFEELSVADPIFLGDGTIPHNGLDPTTPVYRTLAGFESLEFVEDLMIRRLGAISLEPLARLQTVTGHLVIQNCPALQDLSGLEQLRKVVTLEVAHNPELVSLDGLGFLDHIAGSLFLTDLPKLSNIDGLAQLSSAGGSLEVHGTALENLDGLSQLSIVRDYLSLRDNPALSDISGLDNVATVGVLNIENNDALRRVPQFRSLSYVNYVTVSLNAALEVFDAAMPAFLHGNALAAGTSYTAGTEAIGVSDNPSLVRFAISPRMSLLNHVFVNRNDSLRELDLGGAVDIGELSITQNQRLDTIVRQDLETIRRLGVKGNPQLSMASFDGVKTAETDASDNAAQAGP